MPDTRVVVPLVIFFAMGVVACWLVWRIFVAGGRVRRERVSAAAVDEIAVRAEEQLGDLSAVVDAIRRRKVQPSDVLDTILTARDTLRRSADDTAELCRSRTWAGVAEPLAGDIEGALRAVDMVIDGSRILDAVGGADASEGETAVKRGYVNLIHARDSIRDRRAAIAAQARAGG